MRLWTDLTPNLADCRPFFAKAGRLLARRSVLQSHLSILGAVNWDKSDLEEDSRHEDSGGRIPIFQLDSPWAWFYYITFGIQLMAVSYFSVARELTEVVSDSPSETYMAILKSVSSHVPAIAAYSLGIAVTVEGLRMIAERYLARRFAEGKEEGKEEGREEGKEEGRVEYQARLAQWLDANPKIRAAIESGEASPPPFLNGNYRGGT